MKVLVCLVILEMICVALAMPQKKSSCAFGEEYNDGCNHCICHGNSGSTCTRLPSCKADSSSSGSRIIPTRDFSSVNRGHCSLGLEFRKDCNICTCQGDLGYVCTSKECPNAPNNNKKGGIKSGEIPDSPTRDETVRGKCILGHRFFNGCDLCTCFGEFFGYRCSRMENCREQTTHIPSISFREPASRPSSYEKNLNKCPHGSSYHDGYYYCTCRKDNLGYVCKSTLSS